MKEKDIHKLIREQSANDNTDLANALKASHPEFTRRVPQDKPRKRLKLGVAALTATAAFTLTAILVPTLVLNNAYGSNLPNGSGMDSGATGPSAIDYRTVDLSCSIAEYNATYQTNFLFWDTENISYTVRRYEDAVTSAFVGLDLSFADAQAGDAIEYTVCVQDRALEVVRFAFNVCNNKQTINDITVKWAVVDSHSYSVFDYDAYCYCVVLKNNTDEQRLFKLIEELLQK